MAVLRTRSADGPGPSRVRRSRRERGGPAVIAYLLLAFTVVFAFVTPLFADSSANRSDPSRKFLDPFDGSLLGTDHLGRDLAPLVADGLRTSLIISVIVVAGSCAIGWVLGAVSAYVGGLTDQILGRVMDVFNAFPGLILAIALVTALGPSYVTLVVVLVLATWVNYARVIRARVLALKQEQYVTASRLYGTSMPRVLVRHVWPNTGDLLLSVSMVQIPNVMLAESTISFLGLGLQPPDTSLGLIIATEKDYLQIHGFPVVFAGAVLVVACASLASVGLHVRRRWDDA